MLKMNRLRAQLVGQPLLAPVETGPLWPAETQETKTICSWMLESDTTEWAPETEIPLYALD